VAEPTPAATVVPVRDAETGLEVLMLRRNARGMFGGMWVFPGGQVDAADRPAPSGVGSGDPDEGSDREAVEIAAARAAAVREAKEEAGLDLDERRLVPLSFWLPPPESPRRFATWFFVAPAEDHRDVVVDYAEIHEHRWVSPAVAMAERDAKEIELAPPTYMTLWWLARRKSVDDALSEAAARSPERYETHIGAGPDGRLLATLWEGDAGYADSDVARAGRRRRMTLDPAGWRVEID
jgi:8-oxo-dGTP pyrophosphatase MutT (NUDIX family)